MKNKFIILTLCFTLIFSSFNYKKADAFDLVVTPTTFYTVSALAVAYGLTIVDTDSLYNMSREFVEFCGDNINDAINLIDSAVSVGSNGVVTVGKVVLDKFNDFMASNESRVNPDIEFNYNYSVVHGLPTYTEWVDQPNILPFTVDSFDRGFINLEDKYISVNGVSLSYSEYFFKDYPFKGFYTIKYDNKHRLYACFLQPSTTIYHHYLGTLESRGYSIDKYWGNPFIGRYDDSLVNDNLNSDGSLGLVLNPNVDSLINKKPSDIIYDGTNAFPYDGIISIPNVSNPSVSVDGTLSFPFVGSDNPDIDVPGVDSPSVPNEGIWSTIKDFIISLVVPSDAFWTDTWGGLYNNFTNSFPMVDMDGFNDLVTGEKKFPNIDINIMGITGRVVNGDVVNSIVDWLRPIIAGFMMLCLMLFNYRKIYKLIRNTEPFGGIAPGTSDFRTGISEYKHDYITPTGLSMPYEDYLEHSKTQRKWELDNPGKDYGKAGFTKVD